MPINLTLCCFTSRDTELLIRAFKTYFLPSVEQNLVVWSPHLKQHIEQVENVQRRFSKKLPGLKMNACAERLTSLNLNSLELIRLHTSSDLVLQNIIWSR
jgi:hypothetical protein